MTFGQTLGYADLWLDVFPGRDILWPSVLLHWVRLTFSQTLGQVTCGQTYSQMRPWVRLTFGKTLGQADHWSDVAPQ